MTTKSTRSTSNKEPKPLDRRTLGELNSTLDAFESLGITDIDRQIALLGRIIANNYSI